MNLPTRVEIVESFEDLPQHGGNDRLVQHAVHRLLFADRLKIEIFKLIFYSDNFLEEFNIFYEETSSLHISNRSKNFLRSSHIFLKYPRFSTIVLKNLFFPNLTLIFLFKMSSMDPQESRRITTHSSSPTTNEV